MLSQTDKILDEISEQIAGDNQQLPEHIQSLLGIIEYEVAYTSKALMEKFGLNSKEGFRRNYRVPAIEMKIIRMTIPEQPRNRNQRYIKC